MATYYRVLGKKDKYRFVMADYDTLLEADAAIADFDNIAAWNGRMKELTGVEGDGYEIVERTI